MGQLVTKVLVSRESPLPPYQLWPGHNSPVPRRWKPGPDRCPHPRVDCGWWVLWEPPNFIFFVRVWNGRTQSSEPSKGLKEGVFQIWGEECVCGEEEDGSERKRERVSLYFSTSRLFSCVRIGCPGWCIICFLFLIYLFLILFYFFWNFVLFFFIFFILIFFGKVMQCCIIQFPVEIRNQGWQGESIAATRDKTFWEGWMGGYPG